MGVCAGVADYTGIDVKWVRLAAIVLMPLTGGWALPAYFVAGMFLPKKPAHLYVDAQEQKYWQRVRQSPQRTAREIGAQFRDIDRRLAEVENFYVSSNPRLSAEIERLR
jgi:phage shock protein C